MRPETLPGSYRVQACADAGKTIFESDEDDNCALSTGTVQVAAAPDLVVTAVTLPTPPVPVPHGGTVALTAVVKNQGLAAAGASSLKFALILSQGAAPIIKIAGLVPVAALTLAPGANASTTATVTIPGSTPAGTYFIQACVVMASGVESSAENNCGTSSATLQVQ